MLTDADFIFYNQYADNYTAAQSKPGVSQKTKDVLALILSAIKEVGLPVLAILKGSGAAASDVQIQTDPIGTANNVAANNSTLEALKNILAMQQAGRKNEAPDSNFLGIDFSSPTTYLIGLALAATVYFTFKK